MKQFIVDRHTTPSTPTLEQVPTEKVPIYATDADAEADLSNLAEGQIIATLDTGDEMSQPVNVVESGNLHAVTSNAVHKVLFPDYASGNILSEQIPSSGYTVPVDCWCNFLLIANTAGERRLNIDGVIVGNVDNASNVYVFSFSGFIKAGSIIKRNDNSVINTNQIQLYRLVES